MSCVYVLLIFDINVDTVRCYLFLETRANNASHQHAVELMTAAKDVDFCFQPGLEHFCIVFGKSFFCFISFRTFFTFYRF